MDEVLITFMSTATVMCAEDLLVDAGIRPRAMPLPTKIRNGCGICLRIQPEEVDAATDVLMRGKLFGAELFLRHIEKGVSQYTQLAYLSIPNEPKGGQV